MLVIHHTPTHTHAHTHTVWPTGMCFLLRMLLPPDCFHHRATGLFLPRCSVHAKLSASLMLWTTEEETRRSKPRHAPNTHHPTPRVSSAANLSQVHQKRKRRLGRAPASVSRRTAWHVFFVISGGWKIEKSVIIPHSAIFSHIHIQPDETLHSSIQEFEVMWVWLHQQQQLLW